MRSIVRSIIQRIKNKKKLLVRFPVLISPQVNTGSGINTKLGSADSSYSH